MMVTNTCAAVQFWIHTTVKLQWENMNESSFLFGCFSNFITVRHMFCFVVLSFYVSNE